LLLLALVWPAGALRVRTAWLGLGALLGWINTRILLGAFFFLVLTPVALIRRLAQTRKPATSHWRTPDVHRAPDHFEHPY
jgi:hypothetical protein